jgi:DNA-binding NarL/FixJ family response regulator
MPSHLKLTVCFQNRLFRECLTSALRSMDQCEVTTLEDSEVGSIPPSQPGALDLLLIDVGVPGSPAFRFVQRLLASDDRPKTILIIPSAVPEFVELCLRAGADGCVLEDDALEDLLQAIKNVQAGRDYCSPQAYRCLRRKSGPRLPAFTGELANHHLLTPREIEILRLIANRNLSNKQIARELRISIHTVKNHVHGLIEKLSVEDRQMAVRHAICHGLLGDLAG